MRAAPVIADANAEDCAYFATVCCTRAKEAARHGRMQAALGLVHTGVALYERVIREHSGDDALRQRLDDLVNELCLSAQMIEVETAAKMTAQQNQAA
ncbi:MAG TPA: hypothetical protein VF681_12450 [Abditibacteriaceae bacterium]